jgi:hypothetical protein
MSNFIDDLEHVWKVTGMKSSEIGDKSGVIVQTYWTKTSTDINGKSGTFKGATPFTLKEDSEFIPLSLLTEETVVEWIKASIPAHLELHMAEIIARQIDAQYVPSVVDIELPWNVVEEVEPVEEQHVEPVSNPDNK